MSHFNVIQICNEKPSKDFYISYDDISEDHVFLNETDYGGDSLSKEERANALMKIKDQLRPYARVNRHTEAITFKDKELVKKRYLRSVKKSFKEFEKDLNEGHHCLAEYRLRQQVEELSSDDMFYTGYCRKFASILADYLAGYIPQTVYIGAILEAHC